MFAIGFACGGVTLIAALLLIGYFLVKRAVTGR